MAGMAEELENSRLFSLDQEYTLLWVDFLEELGTFCYIQRWFRGEIFSGDGKDCAYPFQEKWREPEPGNPRSPHYRNGDTC